MMRTWMAAAAMMSVLVAAGGARADVSMWNLSGVTLTDVAGDSASLTGQFFTNNDIVTGWDIVEAGGSGTEYANVDGTATGVSSTGFTLVDSATGNSLTLSFASALVGGDTVPVPVTAASETYGATTLNGTGGQAIDPPIPEPMSMALFGAGLAGLGVVRRRR